MSSLESALLIYSSHKHASRGAELAQVASSAGIYSDIVSVETYEAYLKLFDKSGQLSLGRLIAVWNNMGTPVSVALKAICSSGRAISHVTNPELAGRLRTTLADNAVQIFEVADSKTTAFLTAPLKPTV